MNDLIGTPHARHVSEVKIVLTSVVTALALYQVVLMTVGYRRLRLPSCVQTWRRRRTGPSAMSSPRSRRSLGLYASVTSASRMGSITLAMGRRVSSASTSQPESHWRRSSHSRSSSCGGGTRSVGSCRISAARSWPCFSSRGSRPRDVPLVPWLRSLTRVSAHRVTPGRRIHRRRHRRRREVTASIA
jgi:hypothetical protein